MAINLADKYSGKVAERFAHKAYSAGIASNAYDFDGVRSIKVYSIDTVPIGNYTRSGNNRYGSPTDLTDSYQTMTMTQDKAFTYIIDKGDEKEQLNIKKANKALARQVDERVNPMLDKYNFAHWIAASGQAVIASATIGNGAAQTKPLEMVQDATEMLNEMACPDSGRTLVVTSNFYKLLKQNPNFVYTDKLAQGSMVRGKVGELDGMSIRVVPNTYLPTGVVGFVCHSSALLAPMKLKEYKIHVDPPGINGNLTEGRIMHDAFVLDAKANAIVALCASSVTKAGLATAPSESSGTLTVVVASGEEVWYTVDGTDPRCSGTAVKKDAAGTYTVASLTSGTVCRFVAIDSTKTLEYYRLADVVVA